uniref:Uncharacterized protein n=1 Tax=Anguilla anguilla TaxID=7936 RepID=A0A0E9RRW1_ANGAN
MSSELFTSTKRKVLLLEIILPHYSTLPRLTCLDFQALFCINYLRE